MKIVSGYSKTVYNRYEGIPAEVIPKIWQYGFSHEKCKGTGLGLGEAKDIIEQNLKGKCSCVSSRGCGTKLDLNSLHLSKITYRCLSH